MLASFNAEWHVMVTAYLWLEQTARSGHGPMQGTCLEGKRNTMKRTGNVSQVAHLYPDREHLDHASESLSNETGHSNSTKAQFWPFSYYTRYFSFRSITYFDLDLFGLWEDPSKNVSCHLSRAKTNYWNTLPWKPIKKQEKSSSVDAMLVYKCVPLLLRTWII